MWERFFTNMITERQYKILLAQAQEMVEGSFLCAVDILHDAILEHEVPTLKQLKAFIYREIFRVRSLTPVGYLDRQQKPKTLFKMCSGCKEPLPYSAFYTSPQGKVAGRCDPCMALYHEQYRRKHRLKIRSDHSKWRKNNQRSIRRKNRTYYKKNASRLRKKANDYYQAKKKGGKYEGYSSDKIK